VNVRLRKLGLMCWVAMAILVAQTAFAQIPAPPPLPPATAPAIASPAAAAPTPVPETISFDKPEYRKIHSLFFSPADMADVTVALNNYKKHFSGQPDDADFDEEDFLNQLAGMRKRGPKTARFFSYPQFFLESLVYHSKTNWIVWVNGFKITQETPQENDNIVVKEIDQDKVRFEWHPTAIEMERIAPAWERTQPPGIEFDKTHAVVAFTLRPNQTFSSYVMNVLEGKVQSVTIDTSVAEIPEEEIIVDEPEEVARPEPAQSREGLGGLIDAYSKLGDTDKPSGQAPAPRAPSVPATPQEKKP
jgi:hypothetical protein